MTDTEPPLLAENRHRKILDLQFGQDRVGDAAEIGLHPPVVERSGTSCMTQTPCQSRQAMEKRSSKG